jgi:hypothetical protein
MEYSHHKEMLNIWDDGFAEHSDLIDIQCMYTSTKTLQNAPWIYAIIMCQLKK